MTGLGDVMPIAHDHGQEEPDWDFQFAVGKVCGWPKPGNRRNEVVLQLKATPHNDWKPLLRNTLLGSHCAWKYMQTIAKGLFDEHGCCEGVWQFTNGPVVFNTSPTSHYNFEGDTCAPLDWVRDRMQYAIFQDKVRGVSQKPLIIVRNVFPYQASTSTVCLPITVNDDGDAPGTAKDDGEAPSAPSSSSHGDAPGAPSFKKMKTRSLEALYEDRSRIVL